LHECLARADLEAAPLAEPERALLDFVGLVTRHAYKTTDADVETLRSHGWTDPQIAECVYVTALFAFFNRVADAFGLEDPNYFENPPPSR
jgi:alkylhydroperoxidase family enzyme